MTLDFHQRTFKIGMLMIPSLHLQDYRGFQEYKLSGLARVNLLVGKNNSGKTSILEALHLLVSSGDFRILSSIAQRRGEILYKPSSKHNRNELYFDVNNFFFGRDLNLSSSFEIKGDEDFWLRAHMRGRKLALEDQEKSAYNEYINQSGMQLLIDGIGDEHPIRDYQTRIPLTSDGAMSVQMAERKGELSPKRSENHPIQFVAQDSLDRDMMSELWNQINTYGKEHEVIKAMRILEPHLNSIVFLSGGQTARPEERGGILLGLEGVQRRHPLGSYGEGMRRLLALSLALTRSQNGLLLIDEVDTGLHYSVMGDMWLLIVEAAKRNNIQVFLTTHSFDCIQGLAWLCRHHPELGSEVSIQKIERELGESVSLNAEEITIAAEQDIEVR